MKRKVFVLFFIVFWSLTTMAQKKYVGPYLAGIYIPSYTSYPAPGGGIIYHDYFSRKMAVRFQGDYTMLKLNNNSWNFWDAKAMLEYHFFKFMNTRYKKKITPYAAGGLGMARLPFDDIGYNVTLPLALGIKFHLGKAVILGTEASFNPAGNFHDIKLPAKWYALFGIYLTFNFYKPDIPCPAYR